jgi:hypothetical protein
MNPYWAGGVSAQAIGEEYKVTAHSDQTMPVGQHAVGTKGWTDDGRVFYYAQSGASAITHGQVCLQAAPLTGHDVIVATATGAITAGTRVIGLSETDVETSDAIKGYYNGGYLSVSASTGLGQYRRIKRQEALDASAAVTKDIELYDPIETTTAATSNLVLTANPFARVIPSTTAALEAVVGVTPTNVTASGALSTDVGTVSSTTIDSYFFWMQTYGPCAVLYGTDSGSVGDPVTGGTAIGELEEWANAGTTGTQLEPLGRILNVATGAGDGEYLMIDLRIRA